ncbi:MAG: PAS domain S-box protein [Rhodobacteraceae bacterium]|nr:MAG: PAS domain S-box protein [Paracoccaceae bacterium]
MTGVDGANLGSQGDQLAQLRRLIGFLPAGIIETDACDRVQFVNDRICDMLACDRTDLAACRFQDLITSQSRDDYAAALAALREGHENVSLELGFRREDRTALHVSCAISAQRCANGALTGCAMVLIDISKRVNAERTARQNEARLRQILDNTVALIGIMEPDGTLIEANKPALTAGGIEREDVIGRKFWDCYWWSHDADARAKLQIAIAGAAAGELQRYDATVRMADDARVDIDFMLSPVIGDEGQVELLVPSGFEITDRKRHEEQLALVMREVNHRSKNLLAVVQSMLRQMRPVELRQFVRDFSDRLRALSACQDLLLTTADDCLPLVDIVRTQMLHFGELPKARLSLSGPDLRISPEIAQNLGMAFYELATNAAKYGALSDAKGQVQVFWTLDTPSEDDSERRFSLCWRETGGPVVSPPQQSGFGSIVLKEMLAMTLNAQIEMAFPPDGVIWTLTCPARAISEKCA